MTVSRSSLSLALSCTRSDSKRRWVLSFSSICNILRSQDVLFAFQHHLCFLYLRERFAQHYSTLIRKFAKCEESMLVQLVAYSIFGGSLELIDCQQKFLVFETPLIFFFQGHFKFQLLSRCGPYIIRNLAEESIPGQ